MRFLDVGGKPLRVSATPTGEDTARLDVWWPGDEKPRSVELRVVGRLGETLFVQPVGGGDLVALKGENS